MGMAAAKPTAVRYKPSQGAPAAPKRTENGHSSGADGLGMGPNGLDRKNGAV